MFTQVIIRGCQLSPKVEKNDHWADLHEMIEVITREKQSMITKAWGRRSLTGPQSLSLKAQAVLVILAYSKQEKKIKY